MYRYIIVIIKVRQQHYECSDFYIQRNILSFQSICRFKPLNYGVFKIDFFF